MITATWSSAQLRKEGGRRKEVKEGFIKQSSLGVRAAVHPPVTGRGLGVQARNSM